MVTEVWQEQLVLPLDGFSPPPLPDLAPTSDRQQIRNRVISNWNWRRKPGEPATASTSACALQLRWNRTPDIKRLSRFADAKRTPLTLSGRDQNGIGTSGTDNYVRGAFCGSSTRDASQTGWGLLHVAI